jgi:hypothetical protein
MSEIELIRQLRSKISNHIHYNVNGDNWKENKYLFEVVEQIDSYLKERDREFEEAE